jgi:hypothetical protein
MHLDYDETEEEESPAMKWLMGAVGIALVSTLVMPRNNTAKVLEAMGSGFAQSIKAATGGSVLQDMRSAAEQFHERAMEAIGDFWKGFSE